MQERKKNKEELKLFKINKLFLYLISNLFIYFIFYIKNK